MKKNLRIIQFILFLLSNKALVPFFRNRMLYLAKYNQGNSILEVMSFVRKYIEHPERVFFSAFVFQASKEGRDYWVRLSDKWEAINNQRDGEV